MVTLRMFIQLFIFMRLFILYYIFINTIKETEFKYIHVDLLLNIRSTALFSIFYFKFRKYIDA